MSNLDAAVLADAAGYLARLLAQHADPAARIVGGSIRRGGDLAAELCIHLFDVQEAAALAVSVLGLDAEAARVTGTDSGIHFVWDGSHGPYEVQICVIFRADAEHLAYAAAYHGHPPAIAA